jgi:hypothetical protein
MCYGHDFIKGGGGGGSYLSPTPCFHFLEWITLCRLKIFEDKHNMLSLCCSMEKQLNNSVFVGRQSRRTNPFSEETKGEAHC